jgi:hypothetical protein
MCSCKSSGRWIFAACDPDQVFWDNATLLRTLQALALRRQDRFTFRPRVPLFLPREALEFHYQTPDPLTSPLPGDKLKIQVTAESGLPPVELTVPATLLRDGSPIWTYRSGFWMRDWQYLLSGPKLSAGPDYFRDLSAARHGLCARPRSYLREALSSTPTVARSLG